jgi:hypothetical protein
MGHGRDTPRTMSTENAESLRAFLEVWNIRGSLEAWSRGEVDFTSGRIEIQRKPSKPPGCSSNPYLSGW